ncbi:cuticle protein-like [Neodiprion fabricii]|uniref:cuticle protein-like n=1 Tax=Neodiprion fabricii TaxID=2872261 RepID=UPI001ED90CAB|nr:cuticle protein-like [Neodiprion fabricii]
MAFKLVVLACVLAAANAGVLSPVQYAVPQAHYAPSIAVASHAITSQSDNILRSPGNLAQVATQQKTITTPYSSSSKSDVRVSNPSVYTTTAYAAPVSYAHPAPVAYAAAPAYAHAAAPAYAHAAAPAYAHAAAPAGLLGVAYSPAVAVSHMTYSSPVGISYACPEYKTPDRRQPEHHFSVTDYSAERSLKKYLKMAFKVIILCATLAVANAGIYSGLHAAPAAAITYGAPTLSYAAPAITSQSSNILRSPGNLAQISTYSKTIDTPYSSVSKSDVRVSNPAIYATSYTAPAAYATSYAAPAAYAYSAAPAVSHVSYSAPLSYAAPGPIIAKAAYAAPAPAYAYAAGPAPIIAKTAYAAPAALAYGAAPAVAAPGPVVAHATFSGLGASYAW